MASLIHRAERGFSKQDEGLAAGTSHLISFYMAVKMVSPEKQNLQHRDKLVSTDIDPNFLSLRSLSSKQGFEFTALLAGHETVSRRENENEKSIFLPSCLSSELFLSLVKRHWIEINNANAFSW